MSRCPSCGVTSPENSSFCTACGAPLSGGPAAPPSIRGTAPPPAEASTTRLIMSILVTLFCCVPAGLTATVYSAMGYSESFNGHFDQAARHNRTAAIWLWVAFGLGLLIWVPYLVFVFLGVLAGASGGRHP